MPTVIKITPPGGTQQTIRAYTRCYVSLSSTNRAAFFSIELPDIDGTLIDAFPVGSDVEITQEGHVFRGWIVNPTKRIEGKVRSIGIEGADYSARTQKILVTESYVNERISDIVTDLFTKYMPWVDRSDLMPCDMVASIKFNDVFLWDAMEKLAALAGYEWSIQTKEPEELPWRERAGWRELVECTSFRLPKPSETLYPSCDLYPG